MTHLNPTKPQKWRKKIEGYGPCMSALTPLQRRYVEVLFEHTNITEMRAVELAGYKGKLPAMRKMAQRLKNNPLVQAAIREAGQTTYLLKLPASIEAIDKIVRDSSHRDHVKVLHGVLDRTGLHTVAETKVTHTHTIDRADLLVKIAALFERHRIGTVPTIMGSPKVVALPTAEMEPDSSE